ncbi:uncharacterized protein LOC103836262 isoform X2 [Brassica rapa]|uniref:uncharacterized protein LOC103836262 isoform X2 n=1 Tax=Brassica campestris TaxID=3711 RepID=UPI0004F1681B|nr:uncharacterized protein LOC103836262 isoform X2 [Brassica rapa]
MSSQEDRLIAFGCYYGGKFEEVDGKDLYNGGGYRIMEAYPSRLFPELMNQLPISLYGQRVWFKFPYESIEERHLIRNGDDQFNKMCRASVWVDSMDIFVEPETEGDESRAENEREEADSEADSEAERYEAERNEHQFDEEPRVERNVADFVDEDFDEYATPLCSDDDEDGVERDGYLRYIKGSGDLKLRQAFDSLEAFKKAMVDYVLKHRWDIKYVRWEKDKSELKCASEAEEGEEQCMWKIYCSYEEPLQKWLVKVLMKEHTCMRSGWSSLLTQEVIAGLFVDDIRENPKLKPKQILEEIQKRWELTATIDQCRNARKRALEIIKEEQDLQFSRLRDYRVELLESNRGSSVHLETVQGDDGSDVFYRFYVCFAALKNTWTSHCRPIFGLDGCFLKCTTKGQLLAAVGRDANNQMFPIAWAVVDVENEPNWRWFIEKLQTDLHLQDGNGFTVISDRQKGLLNAVEDLLPRVEHRMCARHIYGNLKKVHPNRADMKGLFWKVAKSYNTAQYNKRVDHVKAYDMDVYNSMMMKNPKNCSLAYFSSTSSCDDVSNNISESFNHAIDPARYMPFVEMLETIRRKAMLRIEARKLISMKHKGKFSIKAVERVELEQTKIRLCNIYPCGHEIFEVKEKNFSYKVKMLEHSCTCRKWDMSGLPCRHALKVIVEKKRKKEDYIGDCYLTSKWRMQYQTPIEAVHGVNFWKKTDESVIVPPATEDTDSALGRKKIPKRIKGKNESPSKKKTKVRQESPTKVSREKRIIHCGRCGAVGHNSRKCSSIGVEIQRPPKKNKTSSQPMLSQVID